MAWPPRNHEVRPMAYHIWTCRTTRASLSGLDALALVILMALPLAAQAQSTPPTTQHAMADYSVATMWDLADLYPTPEAWSASYARARAVAEKLGSYKGTLGTSASSMFSA